MNIASLISLWNHTQQHPGTSGARACAGVLLGLYNGDRFPFDLTELRLLDKHLRVAALDVITADATRCNYEVHEWLNHTCSACDFGDRFELLAWEYKVFKRGVCQVAARKELEQTVRPARRVLKMPEQLGIVGAVRDYTSDQLTHALNKSAQFIDELPALARTVTVNHETNPYTLYGANHLSPSDVKPGERVEFSLFEGIKVVSDPTMSPDQVRIVQDGKTIGTITGIVDPFSPGNNPRREY